MTPRFNVTIETLVLCILLAGCAEDPYVTRIAGPPLPTPTLRFAVQFSDDVTKDCAAQGLTAAAGRVAKACQVRCVLTLPRPGTVSNALLGALLAHEAKHCAGAREWKGHGEE